MIFIKYQILLHKITFNFLNHMEIITVSITPVSDAWLTLLVFD
jgi:hypothetical protein